jgi:tetratricopeptide (TPR) repeat protein
VNGFSASPRLPIRLLAAIALLMSMSIPVVAAQQGSSQPAYRAATQCAIKGTVLDLAGKPVADASVKLEGKDAAGLVETRTSAAGAFVFSTLPVGNYTLIAQKSGLRSRSTIVAASVDGNQKPVNLVLDADSAGSMPSSVPAMEFADKPNFTVAGVTDWTAVGGHGSDATLRTSEALARETLALKTQGTGPNAPGTHSTNESESHLRAALVGAPGSFEANHQLGEYYLQAGNFRESVSPLQAAYRIDPANRGNEYDLARAYEETGDLAQSRDHVQKLLAHQDDAGLHRLLGELDEKMGDPLAAVHEDEQAVRIDPSEQNYFAWGSELLLHRAVWQAAEVFRNGTKVYAKSARMWTALGTALFAGALYDQAADSLCHASDLDPADTEPYLFMGRIEMAAPKPLPCIEPRLARLLQQQPGNSLANYFYAMAIWKRQQQPMDHDALLQVETLLTKAVAIDPKCADAYLQLGILSASQRNFEKAIGLYTKAIEVDPQLGEAHYRLGVAYDRIGSPEKAKQEFQLHDEIEKLQAAAVERQRREVKQFLVVLQGQPATPPAQ